MFAYALHPARASLLLALVSAAILLAALALQFLGGLAPCPLCIWQRWPYVALVARVSAASGSGTRRPRSVLSR